jgi:hypothetical protein
VARSTFWSCWVVCMGEKRFFDLRNVFCFQDSIKPTQARAALLERCTRITNRYQSLLQRLPAAVQERHVQVVRQHKGGAWLWESIVPSLSPNPPPRISSPNTRKSESLMVQWSLSDARKATAVLSHAWRVIGVLLVQLASTVPFQGPLLLAALIAARPDKESWLGECFPSEEIAHALLADGARYLRAISTLSDRMSLEEAWRLCRWRSFDTLLVLEAACSALCVSRSDALRALVLTLDLQCCAMFDLEEFRLTSVRDPVSGLVTLCTLPKTSVSSTWRFSFTNASHPPQVPKRQSRQKSKSGTKNVCCCCRS